MALLQQAEFHTSLYGNSDSMRVRACKTLPASDEVPWINTAEMTWNRA